MRKFTLVFLRIALLTLLGYPLCDAQNWILPLLIPQEYNRTKTPIPEGSDVAHVNITIEVIHFSIPFEQMSIDADIMLCLYWHDHRLLNPNPIEWKHRNRTQWLTYNRVTLSGNFGESIWLPKLDLVNSNEIKVVHTPQPILYAQIWPETKRVRTCARLSGEFSCPMALSSLPFDQQFCYYEVQPSSDTAHLVRLRMERITSLIGGNYFFHLKKTYVDECRTHGVEHRDGCVAGSMRLIRHLSYYIIRYYCPTFLYVAMTMNEFWIPVNAWPARIILSATVLLGLTSTAVNAYNTVPVRDVASLFWWIWGLQTIIYMALVEQSLSLAWHHMVNDRKRTNRNNQEPTDGHYFGHNGWYKRAGEIMRKILDAVYGPHDHFRDPINRNKVDYAARIIYPFFLGVFVLVYVVTTIPRWAERYRDF